MKLSLRVILWIYVVFNLLQAVILTVDPALTDRAYLGGVMTPTRAFQWYAVAGYHVVIIAVTIIATTLSRAADRRKIVLVNAFMYLVWDATSQLVYWGPKIGMATADLITNAGVCIGTALVLFAVAYFDRDPAPAA